MSHPSRADPVQLDGMLDALLCSEGEAPIHSAVVRIETSDGKLIYAGAAGCARPDTGEPMTTLHRIHLASVTKTMTAVLVLQLVEESYFAQGLDTRLAALGVFQENIVNRLHKMDGTSYGASITLRHLLTHTGGIRDAMEDDETQLGGPAPGSLIGNLLSPKGNPARAWEPWNPALCNDAAAGVLNYFLNSGMISEKALFLPGEGFHYSDTGFVILGLVAQHVTGMPLHELFKRRIFLPLGMNDTYLAYRSDPPLGSNRAPEAEVYAGPVAVLTSGVNLSFDWAGGGVVSTAADLACFMRHLMQGDLFHDASILAEMTGWIQAQGLQAPRTGIGLGLFRTAYPSGQLWGHSGAWGAKMVFDPEAKLILVGTVNQAQAPQNWHWPFMQAARTCT